LIVAKEGIICSFNNPEDYNLTLSSGHDVRRVDVIKRVDVII
jgi:hypothetical protein